MNDNEDFEEYDPMNEVDPQVRELREEIRRQAMEIVRLQASVDQIAAASAEHHRQIDLLQISMEQLRADYRKLSRMIWIRGMFWAFIGTAIGQVIAMLVF